jgi:methionyl-tRNA formyltransferase
MKIIFFGTPTFASEILESLIKKNKVIATVTAPDKKKRKRKKNSGISSKENFKRK